MKPMWKSKKIWVAILSLVGAIVARYTGSPEIATAAVTLGMTLLIAIGFADWAKEAKAAEIASVIELRKELSAKLDKNKNDGAVEAVDTPDPED